jgi:hypothetical protein
MFFCVWLSDLPICLICDISLHCCNNTNIFVYLSCIIGDWWMFIIAGCLFGIGIIYSILGCLGRRMGREEFREVPIPAAVSNGIATHATSHAHEMAQRSFEPSFQDTYDNGSYEEPAAIRDARKNKSAYDSNPF